MTDSGDAFSREAVPLISRLILDGLHSHMAQSGTKHKHHDHSVTQWDVKAGPETQTGSGFW